MFTGIIAAQIREQQREHKGKRQCDKNEHITHTKSERKFENEKCKYTFFAQCYYCYRSTAVAIISGSLLAKFSLPFFRVLLIIARKLCEKNVKECKKRPDNFRRYFICKVYLLIFHGNSNSEASKVYSKERDMKAEKKEAEMQRI